jgi:hypothetical protein
LAKQISQFRVMSGEWFGGNIRNWQPGQAAKAMLASRRTRPPLFGPGQSANRRDEPPGPPQANHLTTTNNDEQNTRQARDNMIFLFRRRISAARYREADARNQQQHSTQARIGKFKPIWDQTAIDRGAATQYSSSNAKINLVQTTKRCLILSLTILVTAHYCCCLDSASSIKARDTILRQATSINHGGGGGGALDGNHGNSTGTPLMVVGKMTMSSGNGQQVSHDGAAQPAPDNRKLEVMRASEEKGLSLESTANNGKASVPIKESAPAPAAACDQTDCSAIKQTTTTNHNKKDAEIVSEPAVLRNHRHQQHQHTTTGDDLIKQRAQHQNELGAMQSTHLAPRKMNGNDLTLMTAASGDSLEPLVVSASKKKKKMMKKKKKMEKKHKEWKKGKKHKKVRKHNSGTSG